MEDLIKRILGEHGLDKIKLITLIDLGDEVDEDGEALPIIANTIEIDENGNVMVYDDRNEDENGIIEPIWFVKALDANLQNEVMFNLEYTLKNK